MTQDKPKNISEMIIGQLKNGPILILDLIKIIQKWRPKTTKQAVYTAIRQLEKNEQLFTYKGTASLNLSWINQEISFFKHAKQNYLQDEAGEGNFLDLANGEKIKYYFRSPIKSDLFWVQALHLILEKAKPAEPIFIYNPHEWFLLSRHEEEVRSLKEFSAKGHRILIAAGGDTFLDKHLKKYFDNDKLQYYPAGNLFPKRNYYVNIIGDFIIEGYYDERVAKKVDTLFAEIKNWTEDIFEKFVEIMKANGRIKIAVSRNQKKALKLKKYLGKYFWFKKETSKN